MKVELLGVGVLCAALSACSEKAPAATTPAPPSVVVTRAVQQDVPIHNEWIGTTEGDVNAEIRPKVEGYLLERVYTEGALVHKGDPLFKVDARQLGAQLEQAKASQAQAQAALNKAKRDVERFQPLVSDRAVSQQELDVAQVSVQTWEAQVRSAKASVEQANLNLSWTTVVSPIDGIAGIALTQVGNLVNPQTILTTVSQVDPIRVMYQLSEEEYLRIQQKAIAAAGQVPAGPVPDASLELVLSDGTSYPHPGRMLLAGREVDIKTGTITAIGLFPNPGNLLRPGQYAKVRAVTEVKLGAVLVPQRAVNEMQGTFQVAVVGSDNKAEVRAVQPAERIGSLWLIDKGINAGELVVTEGFSRVKNGSEVAPRQEGAEVAASGATPTSMAQAGTR